MKTLLTMVATAVLAGSAVYVWQSRQEAVGVATGGAGGGFGGAAEAAPLVGATLVGRQTIFDTVESIGTAHANESLTVTAKVTDTVRGVNFEDGDYVEAGEVLVQLTNREEEALLAEARANLDDAAAQLARFESLAARDLAAASDLDTARSRVDASQARLDTVLARLSDRLIRAPFAGVLGFRQVSPGTLLQPNTAITTLDDISIIKLDFTVPETFLEAMTPGARVLARAASYPGREFEGSVRTVGSRVDPVTRAIQVRAHVPNEDRALRPGMLLTVSVVMSEREALVVPENAVFQVQDRAYVYVVDDNLVAHEREIEAGERRFGIVEVLGGLTEGERIVDEGIVKLRDGARVRLSERSAANAAVSRNASESAATQDTADMADRREAPEASAPAGGG